VSQQLHTLMMTLMRFKNSSTNEGDTLSRVVATSCTPPSCSNKGGADAGLWHTDL
jgi:hypothetical protein